MWTELTKCNNWILLLDHISFLFSIAQSIYSSHSILHYWFVTFWFLINAEYWTDKTFINAQILALPMQQLNNIRFLQN